MSDLTYEKEVKSTLLEEEIFSNMQKDAAKFVKPLVVRYGLDRTSENIDLEVSRLSKRILTLWITALNSFLGKISRLYLSETYMPIFSYSLKKELRDTSVFNMKLDVNHVLISYLQELKDKNPDGCRLPLGMCIQEEKGQQLTAKKMYYVKRVKE